jgi:hypothetical protein
MRDFLQAVQQLLSEHGFPTDDPVHPEIALEECVPTGEHVRAEEVASSALADLEVGYGYYSLRGQPILTMHITHPTEGTCITLRYALSRE